MPEIVLTVHILCNKDQRSQEDIALAQELERLGVVHKEQEKPEVDKEWRPAIINWNNVETLYPDITGNHVLLHTRNENVLTIKESFPEIANQLFNKINAEEPNKNYTYTVTAPATNIKENDTTN